MEGENNKKGKLTHRIHVWYIYLQSAIHLSHPLGQHLRNWKLLAVANIIFSLTQAARSCRIASFTATEAQWSSNINLSGKSWWSQGMGLHWKISLYINRVASQSHFLMIFYTRVGLVEVLKWDALKNAYIYIYMNNSIYIWHMYYINCSHFTCRNDNYKQCTSPSTQNISFPRKVTDLFPCLYPLPPLPPLPHILKGIVLPPIKGSRHGARESHWHVWSPSPSEDPCLW